MVILCVDTCTSDRQVSDFRGQQGFSLILRLHHLLLLTDKVIVHPEMSRESCLNIRTGSSAWTPPSTWYVCILVRKYDCLERGIYII